MLAGLGGIGVTFALMNTALRDALGLIVDVRVVASPLSILLSVLLSVLVIFFSVWRPAWRASRTMPIDAIRQTKEVKLSGKMVKTSRLTRRLFGFEGEIALKNLKRNRGRYRTTLLSLTVSVVLFLTVSFGIQLAVTAYGLEEEGYACDMIVMPRGLEKSQQKELFRRILAEGQVTKYTIEDSMNFQTALPEEDVNREFCSQAGFSKAGGKYIVPISILILEESSFKAYAKEVDVDLGDYENPQERKAILVNRDTWRVQDAETQERIIKTFDLLELKRGDRVLLSRLSGKAEAEQTFGAIRIADIVSQKPFGVSDAFGVMLVVPEQTAARCARPMQKSSVERRSNPCWRNFHPFGWIRTPPIRCVKFLKAIIRRGSRNKWFIMIMRNRRRSLSM